VTQHHPDAIRLAMPAEARAIARLQLARLAAIPALAPAVGSLNEEDMAVAWHTAITRPPLATFRVLVAVDAANQVVGFAAIGPSEDPDAEPDEGIVAEFCVQPDQQDHTRSDRLLHAIADTLRADGFVRATWWLRADDDQTRTLLTECGWSPDGAHQEVGDEEATVRIKLIRLHTALE